MRIRERSRFAQEQGFRPIAELPDDSAYGRVFLHWLGLDPMIQERKVVRGCLKRVFQADPLPPEEGEGDYVYERFDSIATHFKDRV